MDTPSLPQRVMGEPVVGARAAFSRTFTEADATLFIGLTWDINPYHTDEVFAQATRFGRRIVPGLLTASLFTHMGGLWNYLAIEMQFEFLGPVYIGDTIKAESEIIEVHPKGWVRLQCRATNQDGVEVLRGTTRGYPGKFQDQAGGDSSASAH